MTKASVAVRRANMMDIEMLAPLLSKYRQHFGQHADVTGCSRFLKRRFEADDSVVLVATVRDGHTLGFAYLSPSYSSLRLAPTLILHDLFVLPEKRQVGIGKLLLAAAAGFARSIDVNHLTLAISTSNEPAVALCESADWQRTAACHVYALELG